MKTWVVKEANVETLEKTMNDLVKDGYEIFEITPTMKSSFTIPLLLVSAYKESD